MITEQQVKEALVAAGIDIDINGIDNTKSLKEYDLDSLDFFNLFLELENIAGKTVTDETVDELTSIDAIVNYYN